MRSFAAALIVAALAAVGQAGELALYGDDTW
jgi:hypothetical protein